MGRTFHVEEKIFPAGAISFEVHKEGAPSDLCEHLISRLWGDLHQAGGNIRQRGWMRAQRIFVVPRGAHLGSVQNFETRAGTVEAAGPIHIEGFPHEVGYRGLLERKRTMGGRTDNFLVYPRVGGIYYSPAGGEAVWGCFHAED